VEPGLGGDFNWIVGSSLSLSQQQQLDRESISKNRRGKRTASTRTAIGAQENKKTYRKARKKREYVLFGDGATKNSFLSFTFGQRLKRTKPNRQSRGRKKKNGEPRRDRLKVGSAPFASTILIYLNISKEAMVEGGRRVTKVYLRLILKTHLLGGWPR